jgi:tetratricopeptide (TPR) repeat protein
MNARGSIVLFSAWCFFTAIPAFPAAQLTSLDPDEFSPSPSDTIKLLLSLQEQSKGTASSDQEEGLKCVIECSQALFKSGEGYDTEALRLIGEVEAKYPAVALPYYCRGRILQRMRKPEDAVKAFSRAIEIDPEFADAYARRAVALMDTSTPNLPQATEDLKKAISLKPDDFIVTLCQGLVCTRDGRFADATPYFDTVIAKAPYPDPYLARGWNFLKLNKLDKAIEDFTQALSILPDSAELLEVRGFAYVQTSESTKALGDYTKVIQLFNETSSRYTDRPNLLDLSYYWRATAFAQAGIFDRAVSDFDKVILHTNGAIAGAAYFGKGLAKKAQGDIFGAVSAVSTASGYFADNEKDHQLCEETLKSLYAQESEANSGGQNWVGDHPVATAAITAVLGLLVLDALSSPSATTGQSGANDPSADISRENDELSKQQQKTYNENMEWVRRDNERKEQEARDREREERQRQLWQENEQRNQQYNATHH